MDIRKFLRKIRNERTELELLLLKRDNITVIHALTYTHDKVLTSRDYDISDMVIKNAKLLNIIDKKIQRFNKNQQKAMSIIYGLTDSQQRQIMIMYYLTRKENDNSTLTSPYSLEEVADSMNLSFAYVRHVHGDALNVLRKQRTNNKPKKTEKPRK